MNGSNCTETLIQRLRMNYIKLEREKQRDRRQSMIFFCIFGLIAIIVIVAIANDWLPLGHDASWLTHTNSANF